MNFKDVIAISEIEGDEEEGFTSVLPKWIDTKIELNVDSFYYDKFVQKNYLEKLSIVVNNLKFKSEKLVMNTLDGEIKADFQYYENKLHDLVLKSNLNLYKIDISKGFNSFNNFNQKYITDKNIKRYYFKKHVHTNNVGQKLQIL